MSEIAEQLTAPILTCLPVTKAIIVLYLFFPLPTLSCPSSFSQTRHPLSLPHIHPYTYTRERENVRMNGQMGHVKRGGPDSHVSLSLSLSSLTSPGQTLDANLMILPLITGIRNEHGELGGTNNFSIASLLSLYFPRCSISPFDGKRTCCPCVTCSISCLSLKHKPSSLCVYYISNQTIPFFLTTDHVISPFISVRLLLRDVCVQDGGPGRAKQAPQSANDSWGECFPSFFFLLSGGWMCA